MWSYEDLIQEGYIVLDKARKHWNPDRGASMQTFLTLLLMHHYAKIVRQCRTHQLLVLEDVSPDEQQASCCAAIALWFLSENAKRFVDLAVSPPPDLAAAMKSASNHRTLGRLVQERLGWSNDTYKKVERELTENLLVN
jgi:DNA-directed RNA polymerase specialized sigma24 family protein